MFNFDLSGIIGPILGAIGAIAGVAFVFITGRSSGRKEVITETNTQALKTEKAILEAVTQTPTTVSGVAEALDDPNRKV